MSKHLTGLLTILLFSLIGMEALFHPGLFTAHDIWHQVVRLYYYSQKVIKEGTVSASQFVFPGQNLYVDNKQTNFSTDEDGKINFVVNPGVHKVTVKYQETLLIKNIKY